MGRKRLGQQPSHVTTGSPRYSYSFPYTKPNQIIFRLVNISLIYICSRLLSDLYTQRCNPNPHQSLLDRVTIVGHFRSFGLIVTSGYLLLQLYITQMRNQIVLQLFSILSYQAYWHSIYLRLFLLHTLLYTSNTSYTSTRLLSNQRRYNRGSKIGNPLYYCMRSQTSVNYVSIFF